MFAWETKILKEKMAAIFLQIILFIQWDNVTLFFKRCFSFIIRFSTFFFP